VGERFHPYRVLVGSRLRSQTAYRRSFAMEVAGSIAIGLLEFAEVYVIFANIDVLGGLDFAAAALLFALANIGFSLAQVVVGHFRGGLAHANMLASVFFAGLTGAADGESRGVLGTLWDWVKRHARPRFERLRIDINPILDELGAMIPTAFPDHSELVRRSLGHVQLTDALIVDERIELQLRFDVPDQAPAVPPIEPQAPLTTAELERWTRAWQQWDAFLTWFIKQAGFETERPDLRRELVRVQAQAGRTAEEAAALQGEP
jgi:hypothetical protein